tara:strand:+ start:378 stop:599 length:222 start_codon:yes stop_codon:yes gene_type:complete
VKVSEELNFWQMQEKTQSQIIDASLTVGGAFQCVKQFVNDKLENNGQGLEDYEKLLIEKSLVKIQKEVINEKS